MIIGNKEYNMDSHHVYVMGILNVTPDSFSDGGSFCDIDAALKLCVKSVKKKFDAFCEAKGVSQADMFEFWVESLLK